MRSIFLAVTAVLLALTGIAPLASSNAFGPIAAVSPRQLAATVGFGLPRLPGLPRIPRVPRVP